MEKLTLREAARMFEVSRPTLSKALKSGKLTGVAVYRDGPSSEVIEWRVDLAELSRIYAPRSEGWKAEHHVQNGQLSTVNSPLQANINAELEAVKLELALERQARLAAEHTAALAEQARASAERLTEVHAAHLEDMRRLLLAAPSGGSGKRKGWWPWS